MKDSRADWASNGWDSWERVHGLISYVCYGQENGDTGMHAMCLLSLPWEITPLHSMRNGPFLALQALPA